MPDPYEEALRRLREAEGGTEEEGKDNLAALVGRTVLDLNTGFLGIVKTRRDARTRQQVYWLSGEGGRAQNLNIGATLVDPTTRQVINVDPTGGVAEGGKLSESDLARLFGVDGGGGGGGGGAPAYSGTQAAQSAAFAHDQEMARLQAELQAAESARDFARSAQLQRDILAEQQRFADEQRVASEKFTAEQNRMAEEAMLKRERLGVLQNLVEGFLQSQQRASEFVLQLQPDPFRFAAAAQGMPVMGTTPQEGYAEALTEFAGRPAPSMDPNAPLSAIEGGIESIMGQRFPLQGDIFGRGMASGGTVPMGASGTFLVGERGPEVMDVSPTGVTVKPLSGGFAAGGGVDFDISSIYSGLAPLYSALGFSNVPTVTRRGSRGDIYFNPRGSGFESGKDFLGALGIKPNLVRDPFSHKVFYREGDTLRHIQSARDFEEMGFNWRDVINLHPSTFAEYGWETGQPLTEAPEYIPRTIGPMGNMPFATIEPLTGAVLPAPYRVAAERRRMAGVDPVTYGLGTSAYGFRGGIPATALTSAEDIFTPRGMPRGLLGLR